MEAVATGHNTTGVQTKARVAIPFCYSQIVASDINVEAVMVDAELKCYKSSFYNWRNTSGSQNSVNATIAASQNWRKTGRFLEILVPNL